MIKKRGWQFHNVAFLNTPVLDPGGNVAHLLKRFEGYGDENNTRSGQVAKDSMLERTPGRESNGVINKIRSIGTSFSITLYYDFPLDPGPSGPGSSPGRGRCVVFLGKTLYSHGASLHPGVLMGNGLFNLMLGVTLQWTSIPSRGE